MTDSEKLIALAKWFDIHETEAKTEVQDDLRRIANELASLRSELADKDSQIRAGERLRMMDAASAINEANELRQKIKDQDLIIHGITEGSGEWETLSNDRLRDINALKSELAEKEEEIEAFKISSQILPDSEEEAGLRNIIHRQQLLLEAADKVIEVAFPSETTYAEYWKAFNVYDQLKNTKP